MTLNELPRAEPPQPWCGTTVKALAVDGFTISETVYIPHGEIPPHARGWADLCLALEGGYREEYGRTRVRCEPASLVFHPPYAVYSDLRPGESVPEHSDRLEDLPVADRR